MFHVGQMTSLVELNVCNTQVTGSGFQQYLDLSRCALDPEALMVLCEHFGHLQSLLLWDCEIPENMVPKLKSTFSDIEF